MKNRTNLDVIRSSKVVFAPGDQVVRYVAGLPFFCTIMGVEPNENIRVTCNQWPSGYSAIVKTQEVVLVSRGMFSG